MIDMPKLKEDTIQKMERFIDVWGKSSSLQDAHKKAKTGISDYRTMNRFRRNTEKHFNIELPPIKEKFSSSADVECPSSLNLAHARKQRSFVVTSHTNNTKVCTKFLACLEEFSKQKASQLLVIPIYYRNPNAMHRNSEIEWDKGTHPYMLNGDICVGKNLIISGRTKIQATAANPLSGFEAVSRGRNAIYGHPQVSMEPIATPKHEDTRFMHTTGSVNAPLYSASKVGAKADFHHSISAVYVVVVGTFHYPVYLHWNGEGFYYMGEYWFYDDSADAVRKTKASDALALVSGDIHADWEDKKITNAKVSVLKSLKCKNHVLHDLHNHTVGSHHNTVRSAVELALKGKIYVEEELRKSVDYVKRTGCCNVLIVGSNHNDHLDKWLDRYREDKDPHNAVFAARLKSRLYGTNMSAMEAFFEMEKERDRELKEINPVFVPRSKSYLLGGVDVSQHGDVGINGARGSTRGFAKTCRKVVKGHDHTPRICQGAYSVGFSFDESKAEYAAGFSTWSQADVVIYSDGKRTHLFYGNISKNPHLAHIKNKKGN